MLFFVLMALIFMAYAAITFIQPPELIQWLSQHYNLGAEKTISLHSYVHELAWLKMKLSLIVAFLFLCYLFIYDRNSLKESIQSVAFFFISVRKDLLHLSRNERAIVFTLVFLFSVALIVYCYFTPVQLDELHSWLYFIDRGALVTASYYPASNNHIAYNLLSVVWNVFLSPLWAMRMVSVLSAIFVVLLFFVVLKRRYTAVLSIAGMLLLMSSAPFAWYAIQGRGYVLELLGLMVILYLMIQPRYDAMTDRLLVLENVFTLYVIPIAIIPLAVLNLLYSYRLLQEGTTNIYRLMRIAIYSMVLVFLCYAPVVIFSGFEQLFNNPFAQRIPYHEALGIGWIKYMPDIWDFISGYNGMFSIIVLIALGAGSVLSFIEKKKFVLLPIAIGVLPLILLQVYPVLLFERTWLWLLIPLIFWYMEVVNFFIGLHKRWTFIVAGCFFVSIVTANGVRLYTTNRLLVQDFMHFMEMRHDIDAHVKEKIVRVYDEEVYECLVYYQTKEESYKLLYKEQQPDVKADAVLKSKQVFKSSDGSVLWMNSEKVLYLPK